MAVGILPRSFRATNITIVCTHSLLSLNASISILYTTRGSGHNQHLAICEEFAHMNNQVFYRVVAPTLATGSAFIGITTLGDEGDTNFVGKLIETCDISGNLIFKVIRIELVCSRCKHLGKDLICQHKMGELPYWYDGKRHKDIELMMKDQPDIFLREMKGVQTNLYTKPAFEKQSVLYIIQQIYKSNQEIRHVFVSVDPAAGGDHSKYAITSCIYVNDKLVVRIFFFIIILL